MKTMWIAFAAMAVITVGASYGLQYAGWSSAEQGSTPGNVRLD